MIVFFQVYTSCFQILGGSLSAVITYHNAENKPQQVTHPLSQKPDQFYLLVSLVTPSLFPRNQTLYTIYIL
jgi:hypothetical protein